MTVQKLFKVSWVVLTVVLAVAFVAIAQTTRPAATQPDSKATQPEPLSPDSPIVRQIVPQLAAEIGEEETTFIRNLIVQLGGDDAEASKKAGEELKENTALLLRMFDGYYLNPHEFDKASIKKLEIVFGDHAAIHNYKVAMSMVERKDLFDDPSYLVELLNETHGRHRKNLVTRLQKITGQKLGEDAAAWNKWLKANPDFSYGPFEEYALYIADVAPLKLDGNNLTIDRQRWTDVTKSTDVTRFREYKKLGEKRFFESSLAQFSKENKYPGDYGIPLLNLLSAGWRCGKQFNKSGKEVAVIDIRTGCLRCAFRLIENNFSIKFSESAGRGRQLHVITGETALRLLLTDDKDRSVMLLNQRADGKFCFTSIKESQKVCVTEDSFMSFWTKYGNGDGKTAGDILAYLGVKLPPADKKPAAVVKKADEIPQGDGREFWQDGVLNQAGEHIKMLLALKYDGKVISMDTDHWPPLPPREGKGGGRSEESELSRRAGNVMNLLLNKLIKGNGGGGSGSSRGLGYCKWHFDCGGLQAELEIQDEQEITVALMEQNSPRREITVNSKNDGRFSLEVRGDEVGSVLRIDQYPDGRFTVIEVRSDTVFAADAASFEKFYDKYGGYINGRLFPYLNYLGVVTPEIKSAAPTK